MQIMLTQLLILMCFTTFSENSLALSPASSPSLSPDVSSNGTSSSNYMWIVQGNSTGKLAPTCSDLCVTEFNSEPNFAVVLQPCEGLSASEVWLYDPQSLSIRSKIGLSSHVKFCIDASNPLQLQLVSCSGSPSQMWTYDNQTMRIQGGNSSASEGGPKYLTGQIRHPSDWGSGKNNYSLQLAAENSTDSDEFASIFTLLTFTNSLLIEPTSYSTSDDQNLIRNGGFEECNDDPGKGFTTIDSTQPLYLCSWYVVDNEVEYSGTNLWQPEEGTHSLHLNSAKIAKPASVLQRISTKVGSNYTLGFYMAGNPDINCGDTNKTMKVQVNPSSLPEQELWFDVSKAGSAGEMAYMYVYPMGFTAFAGYVNLTFTSLTTGSCGPVIDNISVKEIQGPLPPLRNPHESYLPVGRQSSKLPTYGKVLIALAVVAILAAMASLLIIRARKKKTSSKKGALGTRSRRNTGKGAHEGWWASFKLQAMDGFDETGSGILELSWNQIEKATKNFTTIVGQGGFSTVYRAEMADGRVGAVKMEKTRDRSRQIFKQELSVLCSLHHPNLVNLIGFCTEREEGILVFEYMAHGSLHHRLHPPAHQGYVALGWKKRMEVAHQVAHALHYLHDVARPAVVHGDIKSANVLLDEDDNAKLCDFGFSSKAGPNSSVFHTTVASVKGSLGYLDPQYLKNGRLSSKSDVYSFGVLLIEIVTGLHAFDMHRAEALTSFSAPYVQDKDMMEMIVDARLSGQFDRDELRIMCNVARLCVQEDSASRPTMSEVVFHLSTSSTVLSSTTTNHAQDGDGNFSSSASENLEHCLYNSLDSDFANMRVHSSRVM